MKNKITSCILLLSVWILASSCEDFLEQVPDDRLTQDNVYLSEEGFNSATTALYNKVWFDFNDKFYFGLGDGRSYNLYAPFSDYVYPFADLTETGLTGPLVSAWGSLYNVVQQSNRVIKGIESSTAVDEEVKLRYLAEARFMRGVAYWYLVSLWGDVIISEDPDQLVDNPIVNRHKREDVWEFTFRDLEFAATWLPEQAPNDGRLTRYSAYGMLSRVYLSFAGFIAGQPNGGVRDEDYLEMARKAAELVITEGPYSLMEEYEDLYKVENNNNSETLFALQWIPNGEWGLNNPHQAYFAPSADITGDDAAWGYWTRASADVLYEYETNDKRRKATWMGDGDHYPGIDKANGGYTYEMTDEACNVKKGVVGSAKDAAGVARMNSALNTYMQRLAEVYLNYAEATLGNAESTTDAEALRYVNELRIRAGLAQKTELTYEDIIHERRVELCMEGQFWYDLVRRAYYQQQEVLSFITAQDRGNIPAILYDTQTNTVSPNPEGSDGNRTIGNIDAGIFLLPLPESELVQNPLLREEPVDYEFTEERINVFN